MAFRSLRQNKLYSLLNLLGLAVGLAASVMILLWVQSELSFDSYHREADRTYRVTTTLDVGGDEPWVWSTSPLILGETAQREVPGIHRIALTKIPFNTIVFRVGDSFLSEKKAAYVDSNWFAAFDYQFIAGDSKQALADPNSVVLTESKAQSWFGSTEAALGKAVRLDSADLVVRAIVRDYPANSSFRYEVLLPVAAAVRRPKDRKSEYNWGNFNYQLFLQLDEGVKPEKIGPQLTQLYYAYRKDSSATASLLPLRDIHFDTSFTSDSVDKGNRRTVTTLGLVGLLILLIASINYVNLTTALLAKRAKEVGMKKIIGAGRGQMFAQLLGESVMLIVLALLLALVLIQSSLPYLNDFTDNHFALDFRDGSLWLLLGGSLGMTVLLSGVYPSLLLSSLKPVSVLKGGNVLGSRKAGFRQALVVVQFAISLVLIVSTLVIYRQLSYARNQNLGYQRAHVFTFDIPNAWGAKGAETRAYFKQNLEKFAGIAGVASANQSIAYLSSFTSNTFKWEGKPDDFTPTVSQFSVGPELQSVFDLKLTSGRWFRRDMKLDTANVILNETAVKALGLKPPVVGQWFEFQGRRGQIIGVAKDFHFKTFHDKIEPLVIFYDPGWQSQIFVKTNPGTTASALAQTEQVWKARFPEIPLEYSFLDDSFEQLYRADRQAGQLFDFFSGIAIFISCLGLFGLATFTAEQRTKEIGVRKVLGASVASIVAMLSKDFVWLVLIALVIASPIAWYFMDQWLADFAYHIDISWWVFALAGIAAMTIALLTVGYQAVRAALMNPVESLRSE